MTTQYNLMVEAAEKLVTEARAVEWLHSRWERDSRYYELRVQQDLFGHWLLTRVWGRKGSALGQIRHELCESYAAGIAKFNQAEVRREQHGYAKLRGRVLSF
jgi:hypothetical protein